MKKIFVTGAAGYVGRNLLERTRDKYEITACDVNKLDPLPHVQWITPDQACDNKRENCMDGCDSVVHLAQSPFYREFPEKASEIFDVNVCFSMRIFEAARKAGIKNFILFSSGGVYGSASSLLAESDRINPPEFYTATKAILELIASQYRAFMNVHIVRPFFIYGPRQKGKLISILIKRIKNGDTVFVNGPESGGKINPVYIDDVIAAAMELIEFNEGSSTINLAGPDILSMEDIINLIGRAVDRKPVIEYNPSGDGLFMLADISRLKTQLKTLKMISFRDGIERIISGENV